MSHFLSYSKLPILEQLKIEEQLLFHSNKPYCLVNNGIDTPSIVLGLSNALSAHTHLEKIDNIPIIRRFTGGGSVIADEHTVFITFIDNSPQRLYPEHILQKMLSLYQQIIPNLSLRENDYVIGDLKVGGNALFIRNNRWLLHTSFLWDYDPLRMNILKKPPKVPTYRKNRSHESFLTTLKSHNLSKQSIIDRLRSIVKASPCSTTFNNAPITYRSHQLSEHCIKQQT